MLPAAVLFDIPPPTDRPSPVPQAGRLGCIADCWPTTNPPTFIACSAVGLLLALAYALVFLRRPPSPLRTTIKSASILCLALPAIGALFPPFMLVVALMVSAVGDAFLAGSRRWLPFGLAAFLVAHLVYTVDFSLTASVAGGADLSPVRLVLIALVAVSAILMLRWLWPDLGGLRFAVLTYAAAIVAMVGTSLILPIRFAPAMIGAAMFMTSDAVLSVQLFKPSLRWAARPAAGVAVWLLYFAGQWGIAAAIFIFAGWTH